MSDDLLPKRESDIQIPSELSKGIKAQRAMGDAFNQTTYEQTPKEAIYQREGQDGEVFDYIKQFYVIRVLNKRFFPWTVKNWKLWYEEAVRTWVFTGDLEVTYPNLLTGKMEKRTVPGVGALFVNAKKNDPTMPVQPDDMAKGARTEFLKNAAYWLGIGFDVYSQEIPLELRDEFEERIREWEIKKPILEVASKIQTKRGFELFVKNLPTKEQTKRFIETIQHLPEEKRYQLWDLFNRRNIYNADAFIQDIKNKLGG